MGEAEDDAGPGMLGDEVMRELMRGYERIWASWPDTTSEAWRDKEIVSADEIRRNIERVYGIATAAPFTGPPPWLFGSDPVPPYRVEHGLYGDVAAIRRKMSEREGTVDHVTTPAPGTSPTTIVNVAAGAVVNIYTGDASEARLTAVEGRLMSLEESVAGIKADVVELKEDLATRLATMQGQIDAAVAALAGQTADVEAAQAALGELAGEVQGAADLVGDADGDGNPAPATPPVVDDGEAPE